MPYFYLSIGDWSDDGHGKSKDFLVRCNFPVERAREAHYRIKASTGIDIESICSEYEENEIDPKTADKLSQMGFALDDHVMTVSMMANLWLFLLQKSDPKLRLELVGEEIPSLHFFGFDAQRRHIGFVGYGVFS